MRDRYEEFQRRDAQVLAIAPDSPEHAQDYFEREEIPFPCLPDPDRTVYRLYDVKSAAISLGQRPGLFIIDKDGTVRYAYLGWQQWEIPSVDETLSHLDALRWTGRRQPLPAQSRYTHDMERGCDAPLRT